MNFISGKIQHSVDLSNQNNFVRLQNYFVYILFFYTFLYSNVIRLIFTNLIHINLLYSFLPIVLIIGFYILFFNRINGFVLYGTIFILLLNLVSVIFYQIDIKRFYRFFYSILVPCLLIGIKLKNPRNIINKILSIYNILILLNVTYGCVDFLSGKKLQMVLGNLLYNTNYYISIQWDFQSHVYRLFSFLGHPLTNMLLLIIFLCFNLIYYYYYKEKCNIPLYFVYLITIIGALICNSKFGIIITSLILISMILIGKNKWKNLLLLLIFSSCLISIQSLRQNVVDRFLSASENGDLTNGRMSALNYLLSKNVFSPNIFSGEGMGTSDSLLHSISNLNNIEIPFIMYMYDYGIFVTCLLYILLYFYPMFIFIKNRHFYLSFLFSLLFIFANSYNGMAVSIGISQILTFITMLLVNMSNSLKMNLKE